MAARRSTPAQILKKAPAGTVEVLDALYNAGTLVEYNKGTYHVGLVQAMHDVKNVPTEVVQWLLQKGILQKVSVPAYRVAPESVRILAAVHSQVVKSRANR